MFVSKKCLLITGIVLYDVLTIWIELLTLPNDNVREKLYGLWWFPKVDFFGSNVEILKNLEFFQFFPEALLLYELSEREPG